MDEITRRLATECMTTFIVDYFKGNAELNTTDIKRIYNDANECVVVELKNGNTEYLCDVDINMLENNIKEWRGSHFATFGEIIKIMESQA